MKAAVTPVAGSMSELSRSISVSDTEAAMVVSNDFPACREEVVFSLNRMTGVTGVSWDFGDGSERRQTASASETLTHSYAEEGRYTVRAEVAYADGGTETLMRQIEAAGLSLSWA